MVRMIKVTPQKEETLEKEGPETPPDRPLLDISDAAVKELIRSAKKRGYVTHDQINALLSSGEVKSERIEDILANFSEIGVDVVETKEAELEEEVETGEEPEKEAEGENELVEVQQGPVTAKSGAKEPAERTDDPVRMYLREMGSKELLSREGEIAIAKRIEAGREAMIAGLCESPLTFQAIIIWRDELNEGKVFLRDIIDLDATYAGPDAKAMPAPVILGVAIPVPRPTGRLLQTPALAIAPVTPFNPADERAAGEETAAGGTIGESSLDDDDDDMENWLSVAAIEAELKPKVIETFDTIAGAYKRLRRLQDEDIKFQLKRLSLSPAQERKYKKLKSEIIGEVKSLRLNRARIDALVEQLYDINKRLVGYEGRLMRLAESHGVVREDFLKNYLGSELDPLWLNRVSKLSAKGWKSFVARDKDHIKSQLPRYPRARVRDRARDRRVPQDRAHGAEGRARGAPGQEGNGGGKPAPRHLDRQEIHQPRPAVPRPHPGRQHRPDEGGRQVRLPPRLQVLDLRHLVDPAGGQPLARRSVAHHPCARAHDRSHQQDRAHKPADAQRDRPRADAGGARREAPYAARKGTQDLEDR
jgi:RNA polymerase primary sigma factor